MRPDERREIDWDDHPRPLPPHKQAEMEADWALILTHWCDECPAGPGEICTNRQTGQPFGSRAPGHLSRIRKAYRGVA